MPDRGLATVEDLVFAAPEQQLAQVLGKETRSPDHEVQSGCDRCIEDGIAQQLPANLVDERPDNVADNAVDVSEVGSGSMQIPGLSLFNGLRVKRYTFMHANSLDT